MTRCIYTKWIIAAAFILFIVATGCYLYYKQTTAADRHAAAQAEKQLETWQANKAKPTTPAKTESTKPPAENTPRTADKPTTDEEVATTEVDIPKMSKFGLGVLPEIPKEWDAPYLWKGCETIEDELLTRVIIRMHNEGIYDNYSSVGINYGTGLITPIEYGSLLVEYITDENGKQRIVKTKGHPDLVPLGTIYTHASQIPSHIKIVTAEEIAIDPYEYLGLQRP